MTCNCCSDVSLITYSGLHQGGLSKKQSWPDDHNAVVSVPLASSSAEFPLRAWSTPVTLGLIPQNSCIHGHNTPGPRNFVCFSWIGHIMPHFGNIVHVFLLSEIFFPPLVWVIFAHFFLFASNFLSFKNLLWCPNPELVISLCAHPAIVYIEVERPTKLSI